MPKIIVEELIKKNKISSNAYYDPDFDIIIFDLNVNPAFFP